uniref:BING4 C-terminal domain-containing protein n=1 Tax=Romanomermis culicivorax TaxID=13658 RepID=A0A915HZD7_ROMCU
MKRNFTEREEKIKVEGVLTNFQQRKIHKRRQKFDFVSEHSKKASLLLPEDAGTIQAEENESTCAITQKDICQSVDIASSSKHFSLDLKQFGPYRIDYSKNGRFLLLGGKMGHVAALDWLTKDLLCEMNVMESVRDVKWLHNQLMYAVAQKRFTFLYDSHGTELHCLKMLNDVLCLDFLPYHFLLAASSSKSFLHWLDVSMGKLVASFPTKGGPLKVMRQNPANAILHCGQSLGIVSLWSPNVKEPLAKMICHQGPVQSLDVESTGTYMATSGSDKMIKIWDLRNFKSLFEYKVTKSAQNVAFSQRKHLACNVSSDIYIFQDICRTQQHGPYLRHNLNEVTTDLQFCPYEDVLGVGHKSGFASLLVPGSGEPNIDVYEANPYQSKTQRREAEVRGLLDKIQPEMITLHSDLIAHVDKNVAEKALKEKLDLLYKKKVSNREIHLKHKAKGKSASSNVQKRKLLVRSAKQKELLNNQKSVRKELTEAGVLDVEKKQKGRKFESVLDRFLPKERY